MIRTILGAIAIVLMAGCAKFTVDPFVAAGAKACASCDVDCPDHSAAAGLERIEQAGRLYHGA